MAQYEVEPNNSVGQANSHTADGTPISGDFYDFSDVDYFEYDLEPGLFSVEVISNTIVPSTHYANVYIRDSNNDTLAKARLYKNQSTATELNVMIAQEGFYYVVIDDTGVYGQEYFDQEYEIQAQLDTEPTTLYEQEHNDSFASASPHVADGTSLFGRPNTDADYFEYTLEPGLFSLDIRSTGASPWWPSWVSNSIDVTIYDSQQQLMNKFSIGDDALTFQRLSATIPAQDTYYVLISQNSGWTEEYELKAELDTNPTTLIESEPNNSVAQAHPHAADGTSIFGRLYDSSDVDYFEYDLEPGLFSVDVISDSGGSSSYVYVRDSNNETLAKARLYQDQSTPTQLNVMIGQADFYYVVIDDDSNFDKEYEIQAQLDVSPTSVYEQEHNDSLAAANPHVADGTSLFGRSENDADYFEYTLEPGLFSVDIRSAADSPGSNFLSVTIYNSQQQLMNQFSVGDDALTFQRLSATIPTQGTYYVMIGNNGSWLDEYEIKGELDTNSNKLIESEPNNSVGQAHPHAADGTSMFGRMYDFSDIDYFEYDLEAGLFSVDVIYNNAGSAIIYNHVDIRDSNNVTLASTSFSEEQSTHIQLGVIIGEPGLYYVVIDGPFGQEYEIQAQVDIDTDADGVVNDLDNCPQIPNADQINQDGDAAGDACDAFPLDPSETSDRDSDGVGDNADVFPDDGSEWGDNDSDGVGDNADLDDDNDGFSDIDEIAAGTDPLSAAESPTFRSLGDLGDHDAFSVARGVSDDGSRAAGRGQEDLGGGTRRSEAFVWSAAEGLTSLGVVYAGSGGRGDDASEAFAVSGDGETVVGRTHFNSQESGLDTSEAFRWTQAEGLVGLGDLPDGWFGSTAYGVSEDGSVIVGAATGCSAPPAQTCPQDSWTEAFRWSELDGLQGLGFAPGATAPEALESTARAVSGNGQVIVGSARMPSPPYSEQVFRWTDENGFELLGGVQPLLPAVATGLSDDGSVIVGRARYDGTDREQAFLYTDEAGFEFLPFADYYDCSGANSVSGDGSIIVGYMGYGTAESEETPGNEHADTSTSCPTKAAIWFGQVGPFDLNTFTAFYSSNSMSWDLREAKAISSDGETVVGWGFNPDGFQEAWVMKVPEPSQGLMLITGLAFLLTAARRRRL